jgi:purine-binding chemotaxis protein CheW
MSSATPQQQGIEEVVGTTGDQYLTFVMDNEQYAVDVGHSQTVLEYAEITHIPRMPDYVLGVINFRGNVLPVIDLRKKLNLRPLPDDSEIRPMIIVLDVPFEDGRVTMGATADSVNEVVDIEPSSIEKAPSIGTSVDTSFIQGIGKKDNDFIIILRSERIFRDEELAALNTEVST